MCRVLRLDFSSRSGAMVVHGDGDGQESSVASVLTVISFDSGLDVSGSEETEEVDVMPSVGLR